jgi:general secretion pathway protein C
MMKRLGMMLMHLVMLALVCAIGAYWAIRILTPAPSSVPPPQAATVLREPDPMLAARMFGLVQSAPVQATVSVQALGAFAAGRDSAAVLSVDGKPARVYLLNQDVADSGRLVEVRKESVTIERGGVRRDLALPPPRAFDTGGAPPPPGFRRDGNTLSAPTVAGGAQPAAAQRQLPPRTPPAAIQVQPQPAQPQVPQQVQPQQVQPQGAQSDQADPSVEPTDRRSARGRSLSQ